MNANKTHAEVCKAYGIGADAHPLAVEVEPGVCARYGVKKGRIMGRQRTYFVDADTGEELRFSGCESHGMGASASWNGAQYKDTAMHAHIRREDGVAVVVTAAAFPGRRVLVKVWMPWDSGFRVEWRALVSADRGWVCKCSDVHKYVGAEKMGRAASAKVAA